MDAEIAFMKSISTDSDLRSEFSTIIKTVKQQAEKHK